LEALFVFSIAGSTKYVEVVKQMHALQHSELGESKLA
jgi:hypothetical protein